MQGRKTIYDNRFFAWLLHWFGKTFLWINGWTVHGAEAPEKKIVVIAAPHTSNWDFPIFMAYVGYSRLRVTYLGKDTLFQTPILGRLFYYLGGIPVERQGRKAANAMDAAVKAINESDEIVLGIAPEGTRSKVKKWKSGFYRIAEAADVSIGFAYLDTKTKVIGIHPTPFKPTGDMNADIKIIQEFYADKQGVKPEFQ